MTTTEAGTPLTYVRATDGGFWCVGDLPPLYQEYRQERPICPVCEHPFPKNGFAKNVDGSKTQRYKGCPDCQTKPPSTGKRGRPRELSFQKTAQELAAEHNVNVRWIYYQLDKGWNPDTQPLPEKRPYRPRKRR